MKPLIFSAAAAFIAGSLSVGCATVASGAGPTADWGQAEPPADVHALQIVTGDRHGCALTDAKGVQCWGLEHGPHAHRIWREYPFEVELLTQATAPLGEFTQVWASADSTCAAAASGDSIVCWGWGFRWAVALDRPFVDVAIVGAELCMLDTSATVRCTTDGVKSGNSGGFDPEILAGSDRVS